MSDDKKFYRERKRQMKRAGNKRRRQFLKNNLEDDGQGFNFGADRSADLNGKDKDSTRKKNRDEGD